MRDTLRINDRILVEKWSYWFGDIERGDIVVFDDPANWLGEEDVESSGNAVTKGLSTIGLYPTGGHLVKRVIGVAATRSRASTARSRSTASRSTSRTTSRLSDQACRGAFDVKVPQDRLWVLGDNREHSADSRVHTGDPGGGFIPTDDVVGKVFVVVWPIKHWGLIHTSGHLRQPRARPGGGSGLDHGAGRASVGGDRPALPPAAALDEEDT